jgi:hypothetical protein
MTCRENARHVTGRHLSQETGYHNAFDDEASSIRQFLYAGNAMRASVRMARFMAKVPREAC